MTVLRYPKIRFVLALIVVALAVCAVPAAAQNSADGVSLLSFVVSYGGRSYDPDTNLTTFSYTATGVEQRPDLSHFDVEIPRCTPPLLIAGTSPGEAVSFGVDPTTGVDGVKWDLPLRTDSSRTYTISFIGSVDEGSVQVAVKADDFEIGNLPGPSCQVASIDVDVFVSLDGATWDDADDAPGPEFQVGDQVSFRFVISNIGNVELAGIALADSVIDVRTCAMPARLGIAAFTECTVGPFAVVEGRHTNTAIASGTANGLVVTSTDSAHYFAGDLPSIGIEKSISKDGNDTWADSIRIKSGRDVTYRLVVTNTGNVPLSGIVLIDDTHSTAACAQPASLAPDESFTCVIGPFPAGDDDHTNTATVTASSGGTSVSATDTASYRSIDDDTSGVIIIIEGPIQNINGNVITIFDIDIRLDPNDTVINTIHIGDVIRVEGDLVDDRTTIIVIAVVVVVIDIDIVVVGAPSGPIFVPSGCKITGIGNNNPRLKCSGRSGRGSGSGRSSRRS